MAPKLDDVPIPQWESVAVPAGAVLETGFARTGARAYLAASGGIDTAPVLGSRSTFHMAGVGGMEGHAVKEGQRLPLGAGAGDGTPGRRVRLDCRPSIPSENSWQIEVVAGPNDDWIDEAGQAHVPGERLDAPGPQQPHRLPPLRPRVDLCRSRHRQRA